MCTRMERYLFRYFHTSARRLSNVQNSPYRITASALSRTCVLRLGITQQSLMKGVRKEQDRRKAKAVVVRQSLGRLISAPTPRDRGCPVLDVLASALLIHGIRQSHRHSFSGARIVCAILLSLYRSRTRPSPGQKALRAANAVDGAPSSSALRLRSSIACARLPSPVSHWKPHTPD